LCVVVVFPVLCVFANLTVEFIKKHNRSSSNKGCLVAPPYCDIQYRQNNCE
jgi:hypothetical protein